MRHILGPAPTLVVHVGSADAAAARGTVIVHHGLSGQKEVHGRELVSLAAAGFLAVGVDAVGHGERRWSQYVTAPERQRYVEYPGAAHMMDEPTGQRAWAESLSWLERVLR